MKKNYKSLIFVITVFLVSIIAAGASAFETSNCPSGIVSYWGFDEGSGSSVVDFVGTNNGQLINGPTRTTGQVGNAIQFDSSSWVSMTDNGLPAGSNPRTVEAWIKTSDAGTGAIFVYGTPLASGQLSYVGKNFPAGSNNIWISQWGLSITTSGVNIMDGNWHHIAVISSSGNYKIYVDGILRASGNMTTNTVLSGIATIGAYKVYSDGTDQFIGQIDEVAIYNRALSTEEIQQQYQYGLAGEGYCFDPDSDDDGVLDENDLCPLENSTGFDADSDGCIDTATGLKQVINNMSNDILPTNIKRVFILEINAALKLIDRGRNNLAIIILRTFIGEVKILQRKGKISTETADMLIAYTNNVIAQIKK